MQLSALEVDVLPAQVQDLAEPTAGQHQEPDGREGMDAFTSGVLCRSQGFAQAGKFVRTQVALTRLLFELLDMAAGIGTVRPQLPFLGQIQHLRHQRQDAVGQVGLRILTEPSTCCALARACGRVRTP